MHLLIADKTHKVWFNVRGSIRIALEAMFVIIVQLYNYPVMCIAVRGAAAFVHAPNNPKLLFEIHIRSQVFLAQYTLSAIFL